MGHTRYGLLLIGGMLLIGVRGAEGGLNVWTTHGPVAAHVVNLVIDPQVPTTIYAATNDKGLFKSTDGAGTWTLLSGNVFTALVIDPAMPATLYGGSGAVVKSFDGGDTWGPVGAGLPSGFVEALAIDPRTPDTVYASIAGAGMFKSTDGGASWKPANTGLPSAADAIAIDLMNPGTLYAGVPSVYGGGVFKSTNAGATWSAVSTGLNGTYVRALAIDPTAPTTLYAGTSFDSGGVYKTTDGGAHWIRVGNDVASTSVLTLVIDPTAPAVVYAGTGDNGVFKSTDGGATWKPVESNVEVPTLVIDAAMTTTLYAGMGSGGVFKSTDGGATWRNNSTGMPGAAVSALAVDPLLPSILYAGLQRSPYGLGATGVSKSVDAGITWEPPKTTNVEALAIDAVTPDIVYACGDSVFKSADAGATWSLITNGLPSGAVSAIGIDPFMPSTLYVGMYSVPGASKSTDGGGSWKPVGVPTYGRLLMVDPITPGTLYVGGGEDVGGVVYKSTDGGDTWSAGMLTNHYSTFVSALAIDPVTPSTLYAGTYEQSPLANPPVAGVYKSIDGGATWSPTGLTEIAIGALVVDPFAPSTIYAGGYGIFKSIDGGVSWNEFDAGLTDYGIQALAIDPTTPNRLYAGTGSGVASYEYDPSPACCQCPQSCAAPLDGACGSCQPAYRAACAAGQLCVAFTPTITPTVTSTPPSTRTPTVTPTPTFTPTRSPTWSPTISPTKTPGSGDCCQCNGFCAPPVGTCGGCTLVYDASCSAEGTCVSRIATVTPTPAPCVGDCDHNGSVTVNEIIIMVNIALDNTPLSVCAGGASDVGQPITINDVIVAVGYALGGCDHSIVIM